MVEVRYVQDEDKEFWFGLDQHLSKDEFEKKVRDRMGYILLEDGKPKGILRYHLFWDQIPFCTLLYIGKDFRNRGFGKQLVQHWEEDMKSQGHGAVLTSAQADETAQHFYRKLGYRDCGGLTLPVPGYEQPPSCFSSKQFNKPGRGGSAMPMWDPFRGCRRCSEGCLHCYIHKGDAKRNINTNQIVKTDGFYKPVERTASGDYKMKPGLVYLCFSSDFLIEEADVWRDECWKIIKERADCTFLFLTKRINRFLSCIPDDWGNGYENVVVCCTVENRQNADERLSVFSQLPIKHKCITAQPLLEKIDIEKYLDGIELVVVGGESDQEARPLNYDWVLDIREQCMRKNVAFEFRQCGSLFVKDGKIFHLQVRDLCRQAKLAGIDFYPTGSKKY